MSFAPNRKIKQVRWNKYILVTSYQFTSFTNDEFLNFYYYCLLYNLYMEMKRHILCNLLITKIILILINNIIQ